MQFENRSYELSDGRTITINSGFNDGFGEIDKKIGNGFYGVSVSNSNNRIGRNLFIIFDNFGKLVEPAFDLINQDDHYVFVEGVFSNGNIITSNKYDDGASVRTYSHHRINQTENGYTLIPGKTWDDGMWRFFSMSDDGNLEVELCIDRSRANYNCATFVEERPKQKIIN